MHAQSVEDAFLLRLGSQINQARHARGWTQARLAESLGIDARSLQRIESGRTAPSVARLRAIADALGVSPGTLLDQAASPRRRRAAANVARDAGEPAEESELLRVWNRLPPARRTFALKVLGLLARERLD